MVVEHSDRLCKSAQKMETNSHVSSFCDRLHLQAALWVPDQCEAETTQLWVRRREALHPLYSDSRFFPIFFIPKIKRANLWKSKKRGNLFLSYYKPIIEARSCQKIRESDFFEKSKREHTCICYDNGLVFRWPSAAEKTPMRRRFADTGWLGLADPGSIQKLEKIN